MLAPGGVAYIGGGFGSEELKDRIVEIMQERNQSWGKDKKRVSPEERRKKFADAMLGSGIGTYEVIIDESCDGYYLKSRRMM